MDDVVGSRESHVGTVALVDLYLKDAFSLTLARVHSMFQHVPESPSVGVDRHPIRALRLGHFAATRIACGGWTPTCPTSGLMLTVRTIERVLRNLSAAGHSVWAMNGESVGAGVRWQCPSRPDGDVETDYGLVLRAVRRRAGLTQQELGERIGSTQSAVARMETGEAEPRLCTLEKLADALNQDFLIHVRAAKSA